MMNPEFVEEDRELHNFVEDIFRKHRPLGFATKTDIVGISRNFLHETLRRSQD